MKYKLTNRDGRDIFIIEDKDRFYIEGDTEYYRVGKINNSFSFLDFAGGPYIGININLNTYNEKLPSKLITGIFIDEDKEEFYLELSNIKNDLYREINTKTELDACHALANFYDDY